MAETAFPGARAPRRALCRRRPEEGRFSDADAPLAPLYFNQASPSAYVRGNTRAVPYALAYLRALQTAAL